MEDSIVCPICETVNPAGAEHCEVCGENLRPGDDAGEIGDQLSAGGGDVVGFAVEDSEPGDVVGFAVEESDADEDYQFGGAASDATSDEMAAIPTEDVEADVTDEEMVMAAPADDTATMDSYAEDDEYDGHGEVEATEIPSEADDAGFAADTGETEFEHEHADEDEGEFAHEDTGETQFDDGEDGDAGGQFEDEYDDAPDYDVEPDAEDDEEVEPQASDDGPDYLYSPVDGTAFPRGSAEYEEGFGPNGEELVATPPDAAFDALEAEIGGEVSGASMDDDELAAAAAPSPAVSAEFKAAFVAKPKPRPTMAPLPQPGAYVDPAVLTVYQNRQPVMRLAIDMDEVLIGRRDPVADAYPDLDLTDLDPEAHISRKHAYIYRQNKNYTLYAVSNAGTQLNADLLDLGERRKLSDGDVIVLAGKIAMKFELPNA